MVSTDYSGIKRLRCSGRLDAAMEELRRHPPRSDPDAIEALVCLFMAGDYASVVSVCNTHPWQSEWARQTSRAVSLMLTQNDPPAALASARAALRDGAATPDANAFALMVLHANESLDEASECIGAKFTPAPKEETFLLAAMAEIAVERKDWTDAYQWASAVMASDLTHFHALIVLS